MNEFDLSKKEYQQLVNDLPIAVFGIEYNSNKRMLKFTYLNNYAIDFFSNILDRKELSGYIPVGKILKDFDYQSTHKFFKELLEKKNLSFSRRQFLFTTTSKDQILIEASVHFTVKNGFITMNGAFEEISEIVDIKENQVKSKKKKDSIEEDFERIKEFFEAFDAIIMIVNEEGRVGFISPNIDDDEFYKPRSEIIGKTFDEIFSKGQADFFLAHVIKAIDEDRCVDIQYHLPIDDKVKWFQSRAFPVKTQEGEIKQVVTIIREITEWKKKPIQS